MPRVLHTSTNQHKAGFRRRLHLKYVLGAYYYHDSFADNNEGQFPFGFAGVFPPGSEYDFGGWFSHTSAYAVFGDATYSVTAKMRIEAGGRYNVERRSYLLDSFLVVPPNPPVYFYNNLPAHSRSDNFLPKLGLQYDLSSRIMAYANWQIGFKSGGVNEGLGADAQPVPYQPEKNHAYEVGIKSRFWDGKATLNVAGYVYAYKSLQVYELINATQQFVQNGDANPKGVEAELNVQLAHYVRINAPSVPTPVRQVSAGSLPLRARIGYHHGHAAHHKRRVPCSRWRRNRGRPQADAGFCASGCIP